VFDSQSQQFIPAFSEKAGMNAGLSPASYCLDFASPRAAFVLRKLLTRKPEGGGDTSSGMSELRN
jgi:hypothetical protein